ncbi:hypothetical protein ACFZB9_25265 [Kitasatospora sp. NPDC008050]|uniref:hypothetical protein n=1 Tax=Kitasatospora sp. NPDC008050 TaxID=3364021 RepID=UPI0036EBFB60
MTCADYRLATSARLDGEPAAPDAPPCAAHAQACADCAQWLAGARRLRELTRAAAGPSAQRSQRLIAAVLDAAVRDAAALDEVVFDEVGAGGRAEGDGTSVAHEGS